MSERFPTDNQLQCAWDDYVQAKQEAERTERIADGIIAGKMWRRFIYLYADPEKVAEDHNVIRLAAARKQQARGRAI